MKPRPFRIERYFAPREFIASHVLCASDCETYRVSELLEMDPGAEARLHDLKLGYTETRGAQELREQIAQQYQRTSADDIIVHTGAEEAVFTVASAVLRAGDHAIVHAPSYQSLHEVARSIGCHVTYWEAHANNGWHLDLDYLRQTVHESTRLVVVNFPHNPTGGTISQEEWLELIDICRQHSVMLFSDEVYRGLEHDPDTQLTSACDEYENAVSLGAMSKAFGLAGVRIGWVASRNVEFLSEVEEVKDYTSVCNSATSELLSEVALRHRDVILARNHDIIRTNLEQLHGFLESHAERFEWIPPTGGTVAFPRLRDGDVDQFCGRLLEEKGVMLLPGTVFSNSSRHFRIGFGRKSFEEGLARFDEYLRQV